MFAIKLNGSTNGPLIGSTGIS